MKTMVNLPHHALRHRDYRDCDRSDETIGLQSVGAFPQDVVELPRLPIQTEQNEPA